VGASVFEAGQNRQDWTGVEAPELPAPDLPDPPDLNAPPALHALPAPPARVPLGTLLIRSGAIRPADLRHALDLQTRQQSRLGDILRVHGLASDAAVKTALAEQFGTVLIDTAATRPDPRLIDRMGPRRCLRIGCLPWSRAGACTLVACAQPDAFESHRAELEAALGPVVMAVIGEDEMQAALMDSRRSTLRLMAETCVSAAESCRNWDAPRFSRQAGVALLAVLAVGLVAPMLAFLALFGLVTLFLVLGNAMKIAATIAQLRAPRGRPAANPADVVALADYRKPVVSIMVALYHEPDIAPRLVRRLGALTYPRDLLDIMLVVEEDDQITREALARADLPHWMRVIPVPDSALRTKPRALNYALNFARGAVVGVYDAEDAPAADQLLRVVDRFAEAGPDLACIQGVLDFYNPRTNWLSRCFTIEYAAWFRLILPGLARLKLVVPLGGTTLFFRRAILEELGGWDAHNVTEDADLGLRLARHGYRTELMDTVTMEEANCRGWPWIKQRSRWLKGYAITYAVHMRDPVLLWRQLGTWRFAGVQVLYLGTLVQFLLAPILWSFWLMAFGLGHPITEALPGWALTGVALVFLVSEVAGLAINLSALRLARHRFLRVWALTLHAYFPLAAVAAWKGCWELLVSPFYWDKTTHGIFDDGK